MTPNDVRHYHPLSCIPTASSRRSFRLNSFRHPASCTEQQFAQIGLAKAIPLYSKINLVSRANDTDTRLILFFRVLQNDYIPVLRTNGH